MIGMIGMIGMNVEEYRKVEDYPPHIQKAWDMYCEAANKAKASVQYDFWDELSDLDKTLWLERSRNHEKSIG